MTPSTPPHPGAVLRDLLEERGIAQTHAAQALGISRGHLNSIINGHNPLSADLKLKLYDFLHIAPQYWNRILDQQEAFAATPEGQEKLRQERIHSFLDKLRLSPAERLSRDLVQQAAETGWLGIAPLTLSQLSRTGFWLSLGLRGLVSRLKDPSSRPSESEAVLKPSLQLAPGEVLTGLTHEKITLPPGLEMRVTTPADAFCGAELRLVCRSHFESGLNAPLSIHIINESGRPQCLSHRQPLLHVQFDYRQDDEDDASPPG